MKQWYALYVFLRSYPYVNQVFTVVNLNAQILSTYHYHDYPVIDCYYAPC